MASLETNEKLSPSTTQCSSLPPPSSMLAAKPSHDTLCATMTPHEKSMDIPRTSDVSAPSTAHVNPFDTDIEAIMSPSNEACGNRSTHCQRAGDCQVWPGKDHWKQKAKAAKMRRSCTCLAHLSKRNRIIVKVLMGILIVGIAVGVGVGISKPLGAGIWQPQHNQ